MSRAEDREPLVPLKPGFDRVWGGYRKSQVRYYVEHAEAEIRIIAEDRDAALEQANALASKLETAMSSVGELRERVDEFTRAPIDPTGLPHRLRRMVEIAEQDAAAIVREAHSSSAREWNIAERMAADLRARYTKQLADADRWHAEWDAQRQLVLEQAKIEADTMAQSAEAQRRNLDAEAEQRRQGVEADFTEVMRAKRAELAKEFADSRAADEQESERRLLAATKEAEALVAAARAESARVVAAAKQEAERLVAGGVTEAERLVAVATTEADRQVSAATEEADRLAATSAETAAERIAAADQHLATTRRNRRALTEQVHAAKQAITALDTLLDEDESATVGGQAMSSNTDDRNGHREPAAELGLPRPREEAHSENAHPALTAEES